MDIKLFKLRAFTDDNNKTKVFEKYADVSVKNPKELFDNYEKYVEKIPAKERYNIYWGSFYSESKSPRTAVKQNIVAFDIDKIDLEKRHQYIEPILESLGLDPKKTVVVYSGNGLQFIIEVKDSWTNVNYFAKNKHHYIWWCEKISKKLKECGLPFHVDESVFSPARILRVPGTQNRKPISDPFSKDANVKQAELVYPNLEVQDFKLNDTPMLVTVKETVSSASFGKPDAEYIKEQCKFLKWIQESPSEVHEPHWYAMLSITSHFDDNNSSSWELTKPLSSPSIDAADQDAKIAQARTHSGPRTCENICGVHNECQSCPWWGKIKSPIQIRRDGFIATEHCGFTTQSVSNNGRIVNTRHFEDLRLFYSRETNYKNIGEVKRLMVHEDNFYRPTNEIEIKCYAQSHFKPKINRDNERTEFLSCVKADNYCDLDFFTGEHLAGKLNLANGVLDMETKDFVENDPKFGFRYCLDYNYDPKAIKCPTWDSFMNLITCDRPDLISILEEYIAYIISNDEYMFQKILIMSGGGANGKSTFINVIRLLTGENAYASTPITSIANDKFALAQLDGKLVNFSEEEPVSCFSETGQLKRITGNTPVNGRNPYEGSFTFVNKAKILISYNVVPYLKDTSEGMKRRLLIVPFDFNLEKHPDRKIKGLLPKVKKELPAVLNRLLTAYSRLHDNGGFTRSKYTVEAIDQMVRDSDPFVDWMHEFVTVTGKDKDNIPLLRAYECYQTDMEIGKNERKLSFRLFCKKFEQAAKDADFTLKRKITAGIKAKFVFGIKIASGGSGSISSDSEY